ncbi:lamin tail domain-containing protein [Streptomyces flaveolus]|uniref:lamin tail domain-containing protein n=1 Tax=Streptomyces flaveolus TaxID=67297 RepID=UPI003D9E5DEE
MDSVGFTTDLDGDIAALRDEAVVDGGLLEHGGAISLQRTVHRTGAAYGPGPVLGRRGKDRCRTFPGAPPGPAPASSGAGLLHRAPRPNVEISDVQYDSPGRDDRSNRSPNKESVEITNNSRRSVNLDGWTLRDEDGHHYTFDDYRLDGRSTDRVHTGRSRDTDTDVYQDRRNYVWDNRSDTATLRNDHGRFIDETSWGRNRHGSRH